MKNLLTPLAKSVLEAAASATDAAIKKNEPRTTALIISKGEMDNIMKIMKHLEESNLLIKGVGRTIKNESKKQEDGLLGMLLGTLPESILRNKLVGKCKILGQIVIRVAEGVIPAGERKTRACQYFQCHFIF